MKLGKSQRDKQSTKVASVAAFIDGGLLLLGRRGDSGKWNLPGGHFEPGEEPLEAAKRELKEETGLEGANWLWIGFCDVRENLRVYSFMCEVEGDPSAHEDPDEEIDTFKWVDPQDGLPDEIGDSLHNAKDVTLQFLGLQESSLNLIYDEVDGRDARLKIKKLCKKKLTKRESCFVERHPWKGEPIQIPKSGTEARKQYDKDFTQAIADNFAGGDLRRLKPVRVPLQGLSSSNMPVNKSRIQLYSRMLRAGDQLPRAVVKRIGQGYHLIDGNHRMEAAATSGQPWLDAYEVLDPAQGAPMSKGLKGIGVAAMLTAAPMAQAAPGLPEAAHQVGIGRWSPDGLSSDLHPIAQLESSMGLHVNHAPNSQGAYHTAFGAVGFKPITAHEEYKKSKILQSKYPNLKDPADFMKVFESDPKFYNMLASAHFERLKLRHGSPEAAAFAWRWGTGAASSAKPEDIANDMYVQKYKHMYLQQRQNTRPLGKMEHHDPIQAMLDHDDPKERILALKHKRVTPYHLRCGLYDEDPDVRAFAVSHPKMTEPLIEEALKHRDVATRLAAVRRPDLKDRHLELVLYDPDVQIEVARHPALTEEQRKRMANNNDEVPEGLRLELGKHEIITYPNLGEDKPRSAPQLNNRVQHWHWLKRHGQRALKAGQRDVIGGTHFDPKTGQISSSVNADHPFAAGALPHEKQHIVFAQLKQRYGKEGAQKVIDHTLSALSPDDHQHLNRLVGWAIKNKFDRESMPEEKLAYLHNYLHDNMWRERAHKKIGIHGDRAKEKFAHIEAARLFQKLKTRAASTDPRTLGLMAKTEGARITDWKNDALDDGSADYNVYEDMLGISPKIEAYLKAVHFLTGKVPDEEQVRRLVAEEGVDLEQATLNAVGMDDSESNREALRGVLELQAHPLGKSEVDPRVHEVEAMLPDAMEVANAIRRGFTQDTEKPLDLKGKHSVGAMAVRDPQSGQSFLLKPGSGKQSPALGAREEKSSQTVREGAFWHVAKLWGIGSRFPRADVIFVDGKEVAALHLLPYNWKNLEKLKRKGDGMFPFMALEKYRSTGELHRWAVIDWVLGNPDRHGQNLMVGPARDGYPVALIDHGSAFAGDSFSPSSDPSSFIPYYLRAWVAKDWKKLDQNQRLRGMPVLAKLPDDELKEWIERLDGGELKQLLHRYGINPDPSLRRLKVMKALVKNAENASASINRLWLGLA